MHNYFIKRIGPEEIKLTIEWAAKEGWNPGLNDGDCFHQADPLGFFVGKLNNKTIAVSSAVIYSEKFGFFGLYIVDQAYRNKGYGLELTKHCLNYFGNRNVGLDGVMAMLKKYERLGFQLAHTNARYQFTNLSPQMDNHAKIVPLKQISFKKLIKFDRRCFPAARDNFLQAWINQQSAVSLGFINEGELLGYGVIRACQIGYKVGPLFASTPEIAELLFLNLAHYAAGETVYLDIPEHNPYAVELVKKYKSNKIFSTARMYLKEEPQLAYEQIYGITSFELG
ncbi:GNAT family N-acetyltransferase [Legionella sp. CNM-1927-20]|uniref:GNAT family N-acetyltransferase n=1 Tax=Legionella sp. CNM-1927-20 TaxID=3422221 RepID=UPI00403ADEE3